MRSGLVWLLDEAPVGHSAHTRENTMLTAVAVIAGVLLSAGTLFLLYWFRFKWKRSWHETSVLFLAIYILVDLVFRHYPIHWAYNHNLLPIVSLLYTGIYLFTFCSMLVFFVRYLLHSPIKTLLFYGLMIGIVFLIVKTRPLEYAEKMLYTPKPLTFEGSSENLSRTQIVPSLDTPIASGKNVIWCASWTMMWKEIQNTLAKEPVIV